MRHLRWQQDMTMPELAERCGCSTSFINKLELGHGKRLRLDKFRWLQDALGVTDRRVLLADAATEGAAA